MHFHKLPSHQVDPKLFDEGVSELGSEVNGRLEALDGTFVFMQLSIDTAALTPKLS
jgi:hypothetical protein